MAFDEVRFPEDIGAASRGGPRFASVVVATGGGSEQRIALWQQALESWDASHGLRTQAQYETLLAFFLARGGKLRGFRFKNWLDYTATDEALAPDGGPTVQLTKTYANGGQSYVRDITKPTTATIPVSGGVAATFELNAGAYSPTSYDHTTGIVTLSALNSKSITAITQASNAEVTVGSSHGFSIGEVVYFSGVVGMTQINGLTGTIVSTTATTVTVNINSSTFSAYVSGGTLAKYPQPTDTLTWSGEFDVPVRFDTDRMEASAEDYVRAWASIPIVEVRV